MERLLNHSGIKAFFRERNVKVERHVLPTIEEHVKEVLQKAIVRMQQNQRKTVFGRDL